MYFKMEYMSPLGPLTMASDGNALIGLWMEGQKYFAATVQEEMAESDDLPVFNDAKKLAGQIFCRRETGSFRFAPCSCGQCVPSGSVATAL